MADGADWLMGQQGQPPRARRPTRGSNDGNMDIQSAVDFLESSDEKVLQLSKELKLFTAQAQALLNGGLTEEAVIVLLQGMLPKQRNGKPFAAQSIRDVLTAAGRLAEVYLKPEARKATPR